MKPAKVLSPWIAVYLLFPGVSAFAAASHGLGGECKLIGDRVVVEAFFDDDTPARDARVRVEFGTTVVAEGRTDSKGFWSFSRPAAGQYVVAIDAGEGHRVKIKMTIPDRKGAENAVVGTSNHAAAPPAPAADPVTVSEGPGREEFTQVRWKGMAGGLLIIALIAAALWLRPRLSHNSEVSRKNSAS